MKKSLLVITAVLLVLLNYSCISCNRGIPVTPYIESMYADAKKCFPDEHVNFLPDLHSGKLIYLRYACPYDKYGLSPIYIHLVMHLSDEELEKVQKMAYGTSFTATFKDSDLMVLDYDPNTITHFKNLKEISDAQDAFPIPNFDFLQDLRWRTNYPDKAVIYLSSYACGAIMDKEYLRKDRAGLSERWEHGMTRGVVIWDNYVAYFIDIW